MKTAAIVPALNEEDNVGNVLRALLDSPDIDEVILVDDGSTDRTPDIGEDLGARVVRLSKKGGSGKANAMIEGVKRTEAEIVVFFDADLKGLTIEHVSLLVKPVIEDKVDMCVAIRERRGGGIISKLAIKIDPLLAIAGERAMKRFVFESIPLVFMKGFMVETALNYHCLVNNLRVRYVKLKGLSIVIKEQKWGFWNGFFSRLRMYKQLVKVRFMIFKRRGLFKNVPENKA